MTPIEETLQAVININIWLVVKIFVLLALLFYMVFSYLIVRETSLMIKTVKADFNLPIKIISWIHFGFSVLVFILALIVL